jgi:DNA-binding NtrC family response regulator
MSKPHILVVDDEQRALETYNRTLKRDFKVHCVLSAKDAWEVIYQYPVTVFCLIKKCLILQA